MIQKERIKPIVIGPYKSGNVLLALGRDIRAQDNDALLYAAHVAQKEGVRLIVTTTIWKKFQGATSRYYAFFAEGLRETEKILREHNIPLVVLHGKEDEEILSFIKKEDIGFLVTDSLPLRFSKEWKERLSKKVAIPWYEVDAHNIVPVWLTSPKKEFAARMIRPKLVSLLPQFLVEYEKLPTFLESNLSHFAEIDYESLFTHTIIQKTPDTYILFRGGESVAKRTLDTFLERKLSRYEIARNDFAESGQSDLSPYISKGMISKRRVALDTLSHANGNITEYLSKEKNGSNGTEGSVASFLEELIIRSELAENYCFYEESYDNILGAPAWAQETLSQEKKTKRSHIYTLEDFEFALTHDDIWNAAQKELVKRGKLHGYMRMYWAKKILEWSENPEEAIRIAVYLNDTYELDGMDPNGYAGIMWSIAGLHDRPWFKREVFGTIRYMVESGVKKRGDVVHYIKTWKNA